MKKITLFFILSLFTYTIMMSQEFNENVTQLEVISGEILSIQGNLNTGEVIPLGFASKSSVACFPATQNKNFNGNHVLYSFILPAYSKVTIKANSNDKDISLYAYQIGKDKLTLPQDLQRCVSCEASYKVDKEEEIYFNAIQNDYRIVLGVAGVNELKEGAFKLQVDLITNRPKDESIVDETEPVLYNIKAEKGKILSFESNLEQGKEIPLGWASTSNMACFPATRNQEFRGKHIFFTLEIPKYSEMFISVESKDPDSRINIYGIQGWDGKTFPPDIKSCVTCEAAYEKYVGDTDLTRSAGEQKVRFNAINRPYKILIGVAGAEGTKAGDFILKVELKDR